MKEEIKYNIRNYNPNDELEGSGNYDLGQRLAEEIMNDPTLKLLHDNLIAENRLRARFRNTQDCISSGYLDIPRSELGPLVLKSIISDLDKGFRDSYLDSLR